MLRVIVESNGKKVIRDLLVVDCHSHMGKDVDQAEMMNPMSPGRGTFDFWTMVENRIRKDWDDGKSTPNFNTRINGTPAKVGIEFVQHPVLTELFKALQARNKSGAYTDAYERIQNQRLIDQAVCFPFQDQFRDKMPEALYRASNTNIFRQVSKFPVSLRMIGYMRVHPLEGEKAFQEIDYWARTGVIRGLKLHPRSEAWLEHVKSSQAVQTLIRAAQYNMPVLFDTRGKQTIMDIAELIRSTRQTLQSQNPTLLKNLKVIIAHFAAGNVDDEEVYRAICQPNTWGDLSMLHGQGTARFLHSFREWCGRNRIKETTGRSWSEYLLFGSDYPYFGDVHAKDLIVYLFNQDFYEAGGTVEDSANILGLNQIKLLPEYGEKLVMNYEAPALSTYLQSTNMLPSNFPKRPASPLNSRQLMFKTLAGLIDDNIIDIQKMIFMFRKDWSDYANEFCLITTPKNAPEKQIPLLFMDLHQDQLGLMATLPKGFEVKHLGYRYFDPIARQQFHAILQNSFPAAIEADAVQMLAKAYK